MDVETRYGRVWVPELDGVVFAKAADGSAVIGPKFYDRYEAGIAYDEYVSGWDPKSARVTLVEQGSRWEFVCFQDPRSSYAKSGLCMYKGHMSADQTYSRNRQWLATGSCMMGIFFGSGGKTGMVGRTLSVLLTMQDAGKIPAGSYEDVIRRAVLSTP